MIHDKKYSQIILTIVLFYQIILKSGLDYIDAGPLWKYIGYLLYGVLLYLIIIKLIDSSFSLKSWLLVAMYFSILVLFLLVGNLSVASVFLFGLFSIFLTLEDVITAYLYAVVGGLITAFGLSLFGVIPIYNEAIDYWVFGFKNPNNVGYYLMVIFVLLLVKQWEKPSKYLFMYFLFMLLVDKFILFDDTALLTSVLFIMMWVITTLAPKMFAVSYVRKIIIAVPSLLTLLTLVLGYLYGILNFVTKVNQIFTLRPAIWKYYLTNFKPKLIGSNIPPVVSAYNNAFDGMYLYYPLANGLLVSLVLLVLLSLSLYYLLKTNNLPVLCLMLVFLVFGFSENAPAIVYSSPLFVFALMACFKLVNDKEYFSSEVRLGESLK